MKKLLLVLLLLCAPMLKAQTGDSCSSSLNYASGNLTTTTLLVPAPQSYGKVFRSIHICSVSVYVVQSGTPINWSLVSGQGSVCSTGIKQVTPLITGVASSAQSMGSVYGQNNTLNLPAYTALCLSLSGTPTAASVQVTYAIY